MLSGTHDHYARNDHLMIIFDKYLIIIFDKYVDIEMAKTRTLKCLMLFLAL